MALTTEAKRFLLEYGYPGNVRELINILEYACIICTDGKIDVKDFPGEILESGRFAQNEILSSEKGIKYTEKIAPSEAVKRYLSGMTIKEVEKLMIENAILRNPQSKRAAAKELGISDRNLFYKIQEYEL